MANYETDVLQKANISRDILTIGENPHKTHVLVMPANIDMKTNIKDWELYSLSITSALMEYRKQLAVYTRTKHLVDLPDTVASYLVDAYKRLAVSVNGKQVDNLVEAFKMDNSHLDLRHTDEEIMQGGM